jgi:hypothetical protein
VSNSNLGRTAAGIFLFDIRPKFLYRLAYRRRVVVVEELALKFGEHVVNLFTLYPFLRNASASAKTLFSVGVLFLRACSNIFSNGWDMRPVYKESRPIGRL